MTNDGRVRPLFCKAHPEMISSSRRAPLKPISADAVVVPPPIFHPRVSRTRQSVQLVREFARRQSRHRAVISMNFLMLCAESDSLVKRSVVERGGWGRAVGV